MSVLFSRGFRAFFLLAALFACLGMFAWMLMWFGFWVPDLGAVAPSAWHAHEMVYGYAVAVVAGFLLTAVRNWTGRETASGYSLLALAGLWTVARLMHLGGQTLLAISFDIVFDLALIVAVAAPIVAVRQWRQMGILAKLVLMTAGNIAFALGVMGIWPPGIAIALTGGVYLLVALVLTIAGRVLPGFIERGVPTDAPITSPAWITPLGIVLFLAYFICDVFLERSTVAGGLAVVLTAVYALRLVCWHVTGLWSRPLLWGLYLAYASIVVGLAALSLSAFDVLPRLLALHVLAIGGIGLATLAMMSRVALGHTARDISRPPAAVAWALGALLAGVLFRVVMPLVAGYGSYAWSVGLSQLCWIAAFALYLAGCGRMLLAPRVDGQPG